MTLKLLNLKSLLLLLMMTVSMGSRAQVNRTFNSLDDLINSGIPSETLVDVYFDDVVFAAKQVGNSFILELQNHHITIVAPAPEQKLNLLSGGTVSGFLLDFTYLTSGMLIGSSNDIWSHIIYNPPVVQEYESLENLLDAEIQGAVTVSVNINNKIRSFKYSDGLRLYQLSLETESGKSVILSADLDSAPDWEVGGTLKGTLTNVAAYIDPNSTLQLTNYAGNIFKGLTYTAPAVGTISISSVGYATYFTDKEFVMPEGLEGYVVTPKDETSVTLTKTFDGGQTVPASTALLVKGEAGSYPCAGSNTGATFTGDNCLYGNLAAGTVAAVPGASKYYKLLNGSNGLGWYLGAPDGGVFSLGANKAYLALSETQAQNAKALSLNFDEATAIENINADAENVRAFNLAGQRVNAANHKGIVIVNGKKIVNK